jgi:hypothetical protein
LLGRRDLALNLRDSLEDDIGKIKVVLDWPPVLYIKTWGRLWRIGWQPKATKMDYYVLLWK